MTDEDVVFDAEDEYDFVDPSSTDGDFELLKPSENSEGNSVIGEFTGTVDFGYGDVFVVDELGSDKAYGFPGNSVLGGDDGEFAPIEEGDVVKVEYLGKVQPEDEAKEPYANYNVTVGRQKE